jgi:hypothetical protein
MHPSELIKQLNMSGYGASPLLPAASREGSLTEPTVDARQLLTIADLNISIDVHRLRAGEPSQDKLDGGDEGSAWRPGNTAPRLATRPPGALGSKFRRMIASPRVVEEALDTLSASTQHPTAVPKRTQRPDVGNCE